LKIMVSFKRLLMGRIT